MSPESGGTCGRLIHDLPSARLQGGNGLFPPLSSAASALPERETERGTSHAHERTQMPKLGSELGRASIAMLERRKRGRREPPSENQRARARMYSKVTKPGRLRTRKACYAIHSAVAGTTATRRRTTLPSNVNLQLFLGSCVVQIWSRTPPILEVTKPCDSSVWRGCT